MANKLEKKSAIAAIRASSAKQGIDGDSPEAQKEQIEQFAKNKNIIIEKFFVFLESASKEQQPMQEAIDYCKKNKVDLFIIKSIDRFTRGGSYSYDHLKMQLDNSGVSLVDIYGIISSEKVNTLDHLGFEYDWSIYSPSKKSEILEAERAKDEMRDIMSRMIGAEIRYTKLGYWMRRPPYGYQSKSTDSVNGKRRILEPHPEESQFVQKLFELRCGGMLSDEQIVAKLNSLGYRTRTDVLRDKNDRTKIIGRRGGIKMDLKAFHRYLRNPIYAGINCEKWTDNKPIKCKFDGLVSIEMFNKANHGKISISKLEGVISIDKQKLPNHLLRKRVVNPDFPYKKIIMCSKCEKPLSGSASRGKLGKYYPAYHCSRKGHYMRVPKAEFDVTIESFVKQMKVRPEFIDQLEKLVLVEWDKRQKEEHKDTTSIDLRVSDLQIEADQTAQKFKMVSSETAMKCIEQELISIDEQIKSLNKEKESMNKEKPTDMQSILKTVRYFLEHLDYLLLKQIDPVKKANFFGVLFDTAPTYEEIEFGTQNPSLRPKLNQIFAMDSVPLGKLEGHRQSCSNSNKTDEQP